MMIFGLLVMVANLLFALMLVFGVIILVGAAVGFTKAEGRPVWRSVCVILLVLGGLMAVSSLGFLFP